MCQGASIVLYQGLFRSPGIAQALNRSPETFLTRLCQKGGQNILAIDAVRAEFQSQILSRGVHSNEFGHRLRLISQFLHGQGQIP